MKRKREETMDEDVECPKDEAIPRFRIESLILYWINSPVEICKLVASFLAPRFIKNLFLSPFDWEFATGPDDMFITYTDCGTIDLLDAKCGLISNYRTMLGGILVETIRDQGFIVYGHHLFTDKPKIERWTWKPYLQQRNHDDEPLPLSVLAKEAVHYIVPVDWESFVVAYQGRWELLKWNEKTADVIKVIKCDIGLRGISLPGGCVACLHDTGLQVWKTSTDSDECKFIPDEGWLFGESHGNLLLAWKSEKAALFSFDPVSMSLKKLWERKIERQPYDTVRFYFRFVRHLPYLMFVPPSTDTQRISLLNVENGESTGTRLINPRLFAPDNVICLEHCIILCHSDGLVRILS